MTTHGEERGRIGRGESAEDGAALPPRRLSSASGGVFCDFEAEYGPLEKGRTVWSVLDALLKTPARVVHELVEGCSMPVAGTLTLLSAFAAAAYGFVMASYSGGPQFWAVPLKLVVGLAASAAISLPSLYIFSCIAGSRLQFPVVTRLLVMFLALCGVLLVGFAPVVWVFSQSTRSLGFMGLLHLLFWVVSVLMGLRLLSRSFAALNGRRLPILRVWSVIFLIVSFQMATVLRPLVGPFEGFHQPKKAFFLAHWVESLDD